MKMNNAAIMPEFSLIDLVKSKGLSLEEVGLYVMLWAISDKSLILYNITDLAKLGNCGIDKINGLMPGEDYEAAKKEFSR